MDLFCRVAVTTFDCFEPSYGQFYRGPALSSRREQILHGGFEIRRRIGIEDAADAGARCKGQPRRAGALSSSAAAILNR